MNWILLETTLDDLFEYCNTNIIDKFINEEMSDESFEALEEKSQDVR